ncbi:MAG: aldo/keto reductase [Bacteroidales bacterium]|nr:aldo/keto reductase [Bacteroidales bacterium]MBN2773740.1 aldo/keto reductase [Prolixibacteraceae bacterium]
MDIGSRTTLNNGVEMPWFGLGVFESEEGGEVEKAVAFALANGYRSIDTASFYRNEKGVGDAVRLSKIPREDIFITSKLWNSEQGYKNTYKAFESSLEKLQVSYLDLYLIHWPGGKKSVDSWKAMEELYKEGKIRSIGVSNFLVKHLKEFLPECRIRPAVNQVEFHPWLVQPELLVFCKENKIQPEAWSPIMKGRVNDIPVLKTIAEKYRKSPVQVVLRWDIQMGVITIPKSVKPERITSNAGIFDFELDENEMALISQLDKNRRLGPHPDEVIF